MLKRFFAGSPESRAKLSDCWKICETLGPWSKVYSFRFLISSNAAATVPCGLSLSSGYRISHWLSASSDLKKLMTPQPPPAKKTVDAGSAVTNFPLSKTKWIRDVPSGEESSIVSLSFASLSLTSDSESSAQFTLNCRPLSRLIL